MKSFLLAMVFLFCIFYSHAQYNDSQSHYVRFAASGNLNRSNNASSYLLTNEARYSIKKRWTTLNTVASWLYGEQGSQLTNNDFTSTADFNFYHDSAKLYYWALANYTTSYSLKIRNQAQSGFGAAYNFVNTTNAWFNMSDGILYETSHLSTSDPVLNQYQTFRNSLRLSYKFIIGNKVTINGSNFLQQALGHHDDYIVRTSNSVGVKLNNWISINTTVGYNQFRRTGTDNLLFTYGIVAEKYF